MNFHLLIQKIGEIEKFIASQSLVNKDVMTLKVAAAFMGVSTSYLHKLTSGGEIPFSKPRQKLIYFKKEDLESRMLQNRFSPKSEITELPQPRKLKSKKGN